MIVPSVKMIVPSVKTKMQYIWSQSVWKIMFQSKIVIAGWWLSHPFEKYEFVNGKDYPIYEMENNMFQTNQWLLTMINHH